MLPNLLALALLSTLCHAVPLYERATCPDYALVVARGTGEPQGPSIGFKGEGINGMTNQTFTAVPNGIEYDVVYPADLSPNSEAEGGADAVRYINNARASCPKQKFALLGYSQGATVVLKALQTFNGTDDFVKAIVFLGNPYQQKNQISTVDQNGGNSTRGYDGSLLFMDPSLALSNRLATSGKVAGICYMGDPVCIGPMLSSFTSNHFAYGFSPGVQTLGTNLLVSKLS